MRFIINLGCEPSDPIAMGFIQFLSELKPVEKRHLVFAHDDAITWVLNPDKCFARMRKLSDIWVCSRSMAVRYTPLPTLPLGCEYAGLGSLLLALPNYDRIENFPSGLNLPVSK